MAVQFQGGGLANYFTWNNVGNVNPTKYTWKINGVTKVSDEYPSYVFNVYAAGNYTVSCTATYGSASYTAEKKIIQYICDETNDIFKYNEHTIEIQEDGYLLMRYGFEDLDGGADISLYNACNNYELLYYDHILGTIATTDPKDGKITYTGPYSYESYWKNEIPVKKGDKIFIRIPFTVNTNQRYGGKISSGKGYTSISQREDPFRR